MYTLGGVTFCLSSAFRSSRSALVSLLSVRLLFPCFFLLPDFDLPLLRFLRLGLLLPLLEELDEADEELVVDDEDNEVEEYPDEDELDEEDDEDELDEDEDEELADEEDEDTEPDCLLCFPTGFPAARPVF